jgi:hypothetical protein
MHSKMLFIAKIYNAIIPFPTIRMNHTINAFSIAWLGLASSQIGFENSELDIFKKKISQFNFYTQKNKKLFLR